MLYRFTVCNIVSGEYMGINNKKIQKDIDNLKKHQHSLDKQEKHPCYMYCDLMEDGSIYTMKMFSSSITYNNIIKKYYVEFNDFNHQKITNIRFDPLEEDFCIISGISVCIDGTQTAINPVNGERYPVADVFYSTDPQYLIDGIYNSPKKIQIFIDDIIVVSKYNIKYMPLIGHMIKRQQYNRIIALIQKTINNFRKNGLRDTIVKVRSYIKQRKVTNNSEIHSQYNVPYQSNEVLNGCRTSIKPICFYLPQFHTFKENNEWWGEGFTEWTNTRKAKPKFDGHYQPREPHNDFGYYTLDNKEILQKQAKLAKEHGIYGFCFYYYWFSGKRLMEKPVDIFIANKDIDINFCLCWANENWTRTWDGLEKNVLIKQDYTEEDNINFIKDLKKYIDDERYIKVDGKPVIIVYNPKAIPNCKKTFAAWRKTAKETGIGDILIWICQTHDVNVNKLDIVNEVDGEIEFPPLCSYVPPLDINMFSIKEDEKPAGIYLYDTIKDSFIHRNRSKSIKQPVFKTVMMAWDNSARRKTGWASMLLYSLESFYKWVKNTVEYTENYFQQDRQFMFINAWNEWAEGTYLEPDKKTGYANINTFSRALYKLPFMKEIVDIKKCSSINYFEDKTEIAVQAHIFYTDLAEEIIYELNKIPYKFDCYISTDTDEKADILKNIFKEKSKAENVYVEVFANRGRDMLPFITQILKVIENYKYVCHIHSKKTLTNTVGEGWRKYLFKHLFGNEKNICGIFDIFENTNTGIIFPKTFEGMVPAAVWGSNLENTKNLLKKMNIDIMLPENHLIFPVGNMFWAKTKAVKQIFEHCSNKDDYALEAGQVDGTIAHAIERLWVYIAEYNGYTYMNTANKIK